MLKRGMLVVTILFVTGLFLNAYAQTTTTAPAEPSTTTTEKVMGTITKIDPTTLTLTVMCDKKEASYTYNEKSVITVAGKVAKMTDVKVDQKVKLEVKDNVIVSLVVDPEKAQIKK